jgi:hypothetical protein
MTNEQKQEQTILDSEGNEVKVGSKVRYWDNPEHGDIGEVIEITDFEGDADDEGRSIMNEPEVVVKYPDGSVEKYPTNEWKFREYGMVMTDDGPEPEGMSAEGKVEECVVVTE